MDWSQRLFFILASALLVNQFAFGEWSIWEKTKKNSYQIDGYIKTIAVNEDQHQIIVRVAKAENPTQVDTLKVCYLESGSDLKSFEQSQKMETLRKALASGERIKVSYNSPFDRCLSHVEAFASKSDGPSRVTQAESY